MSRPLPLRAIGRARRAAGWTLLSLGVSTVGLWALSAWWYFGWVSVSGRGIGCGCGLIGVCIDSPDQPGWAWQTHDDAPTLLWRYAIRERESGWTLGVLGVTRYGDDETDFDVLLWPVACVLLVPAALLLRSGVLARRRAMCNLCTGCGYSRAGIASGAPCPECGREPPRPSPAPQ